MTRPLSDREALKLSKGRAHLLRLRPYFASAVLSMRPYAAEGLGTFAVDSGWNLYVDPCQLELWSPAEIGAVLEHELGHLLRDHHGRGNDFPVAAHEQGLWNLACDMAINDDLLAEGRPLPGQPPSPVTLGLQPYRMEEHYFDELVASAEASAAALTAAGEIDCGSAVGGRPRPYEIDDPGLGMAEIEALRRATARSIERHGVSASLTWRQWATSMSPSMRVDWESMLADSLASLVSTADRDRRTYRRTSRRPADAPFLARGRLRERPRVVIVIDVSGSMSEAALGVVTGELAAMEHAGVVGNSFVIVCDDEVRSVEPLHEFSVRSLRGGGGTDMRVAIDAAERSSPDAIIVFTDGETPWPAVPSAAPLLVVLVDATAKGRRAVPPWAGSVAIDRTNSRTRRRTPTEAGGRKHEHIEHNPSSAVGGRPRAATDDVADRDQ